MSDKSLPFSHGYIDFPIRMRLEDMEQWDTESILMFWDGLAKVAIAMQAQFRLELERTQRRISAFITHLPSDVDAIRNDEAMTELHRLERIMLNRFPPRKCKVCGQPTIARGLCVRHYQSNRRQQMARQT